MDDAHFTLYSYYLSSAPYRVRIALNLKGLSFATVPIDLLAENGGDQRGGSFRRLNPLMRVPALEIESGGQRHVLTQSVAIIEWLEERYPTPALLPLDPLLRARARAIAMVVACDMHALNNRSTLEYLRRAHREPEVVIEAWRFHWFATGFDAIEAMLEPGQYAIGDSPTIADICLVPQVAFARRMGFPLDSYPRIDAVDRACGQLDAFVRARPEFQPGFRP